MKSIIPNNKNMMKVICTVFFIFIIVFSSCKKFVAIPPPQNQVVTATAFASDQSATSAIAGLYSQIMQTNLLMLNGAMSLFPALSADELYNTSPSPMITPFTNNAISPNDFFTIYNRIWRWGYNYIYQANACIEGIARSSGISPAVKNQLTGEVKVVRALCYFYLVNLFGDVPLETTTDYRLNATMPRTSSEKIYQQIISDLSDAQMLLGTNLSVGHTIPDKWTATALLARVYLYQQNWQLAETLSSAVIDSGGYQLESDLNQVFLSTSTGTIWQLAPVAPFFNTAEGYTFIPASNRVKPAYALTPYFLNAFENGDLRKADWTDSVTIGGSTYYYPYKYKVRSGSVKTEYNIVLRLAEQYLIRAEARAHQNNINGAVSDLNIIRQRAGLPPLSDKMNQTECLKAVLKERQTELFAEWGHRWFDLKRTGEVDSVLGAEKSGWKPAAALYPIPFSQLEANPSLTQNPGY